MIHSQDLCFVVSGRFTYKDIQNLHILKKKFPDSQIILSTWKDDFGRLKEEEKDTIADLNLEIVLTKDPNSEVRDVFTGRCINYIRQISSFTSAIQSINRKYVMKLRSDLYFKDYKFLQKKELRNDLDQDKIIVLNVTSVNTSRWRGRKMPFHICDWLYFAKKEVIVDFFNQQMISEKSFIKYKQSKIENELDINVSDISLLSPEQLFVLLSPKFKKIKFKLGQYVNDPSILKLSENLISKYFAIYHAKYLSIKSTKYGVNSMFYQYYMYQSFDKNNKKSVFKKFIKIFYLTYLYLKHLLARLYFIFRRIYYIH